MNLIGRAQLIPGNCTEWIERVYVIHPLNQDFPGSKVRSTHIHLFIQSCHPSSISHRRRKKDKAHRPSMGYKQKHKQAPPRPLPGTVDNSAKRRRDKGKKKASSVSQDERRSLKAVKSAKARSGLGMGKQKKRKEVLEEEEDSDLEDALRRG